MQPSLTRPERLLALAAAAVVIVALLAPGFPQPPHAHHFADQRALWGIPHALDVLSNLPFALAGAWGLLLLRLTSAAALSPGQRLAAGLFFAGLIVTAFGSSWYHWEPDDAGLAVDRASMSVAFAGMLALVAAAGVSDRAGRALGAALLVLGPASVLAWYFTANVLPWALVQFGGVPLLVLFALRGPRPGGLPVRWGLVLLAYALAKLCEMNDELLFRATGELLSGHTLKHLVAATAALPVLHAMGGRQNAPEQVAILRRA